MQLRCASVPLAFVLGRAKHEISHFSAHRLLLAI